MISRLTVPRLLLLVLWGGLSAGTVEVFTGTPPGFITRVEPREAATVKFARDLHLGGGTRLKLPLQKCLGGQFVQDCVTGAFDHLHFAETFIIDR
jgi:hypothetical protein